MRRTLIALTGVLGLLALRGPVPFDSSMALLARGAPSARIVAIGDIHGDIDAFTGILRTAGLTDTAGNWTGGRSVFVQTGDFTDRGENVRAVMDRLMAIEAQAKAGGGRVVTLLGNHEAMNLVAETRDANEPIYAKFADDKSEARREAAWEQYQKVGPSPHAKTLPAAAVYSQAREQWMAAHPPGFIEYREALGPGGKYGKWLRGKHMAATIGGSVFMHAGIAPEAAPEKVNDLNAQVRDEVKRFDRYVQRLVDKKLALPFFTLTEILQVSANEIRAANALIDEATQSGEEVDRSKLDVPLLTEAAEILKIDQWLVLNGERALWYRGFATLPDDPTGGPLAPLLAKYDAVRFVTGHTPTADRRINVRFGGRAVLIDTGMLSTAYQGRASALEIDGDRLTAIYEDGRVPLTVAKAAAAARRN